MKKLVAGEDIEKEKLIMVGDDGLAYAARMKGCKCPGYFTASKDCPIHPVISQANIDEEREAGERVY